MTDDEMRCRAAENLSVDLWWSDWPEGADVFAYAPIPGTRHAKPHPNWQPQHDNAQAIALLFRLRLFAKVVDRLSWMENEPGTAEEKFRRAVLTEAALFRPLLPMSAAASS